MDLWVVAAATGAGYLAKHWQNSISKEKKEEDLTESFSGNLILSNPESWNFFHPIRRLTQDQRSKDIITSKGDGIIIAASGRNNYDNMQEEEEEEEEFFRYGTGSRDDFSGAKESCSFGSVKKKKKQPIGSGCNGSSSVIKPLIHSSLGKSCVEYSVSGSNVPAPPFSMAVRMLLLTDADFETNGIIPVCPPEKQESTIRRSSCSGTRVEANGMLVLFWGITIGIMSMIIANRRQVKQLNDLLKQTKNRVADLHEKIELKDFLTVEEIKGLDSPNASPAEQKSHDSTEDISSHEEPMTKIEAELEAELDRLQLNMITSNSNTRIHAEHAKMGADFDVDLVRGDLRLDKSDSLPDDDLSNPNNDDISEIHDDVTNTASYAVSPWELSIRLHELIESRLKERITELERALEHSRNGVNSIDLERKITCGDLYTEMESSLTRENSTYIYDGKPFENSNGLPCCPIERRWSGQGDLGHGNMDQVLEEDEDDDDAEMGKLLIMQIVEKRRQGSSLVLNAQQLLCSIDDS